jgi:hypothetical protein
MSLEGALFVKRAAGVFMQGSRSKRTAKKLIAVKHETYLALTHHKSAEVLKKELTMMKLTKRELTYCSKKLLGSVSREEDANRTNAWKGKRRLTSGAVAPDETWKSASSSPIEAQQRAGAGVEGTRTNASKLLQQISIDGSGSVAASVGTSPSSQLKRGLKHRNIR